MGYSLLRCRLQTATNVGGNGTTGIVTSIPGASGGKEHAFHIINDNGVVKVLDGHAERRFLLQN